MKREIKQSNSLLLRINLLWLLVLLSAGLMFSPFPAKAAISDGTVDSEQKISDTAGGFAGILDDSDTFGFSVASIGDLDGDGVQDIAVGAELDDDGGTNRGAVWILFMNANGTVKSHQKISDTAGGFAGILDDFDFFGSSVASMGLLDGDMVPDLAVGAFNDGDGGAGRGAVWILFMNTNGTVKSHQKISDTAGGFAGILDNSDLFGISVASIGDLDGDNVTDLAVGALFDEDGGPNRGAVWILFMNSVPDVCVAPPADLVGWWPGDGDATDIVGGNDGVLQNGATFADGLVVSGNGQAFILDGVDDEVVVPDSPNLNFGPTDPITIDAWVFRTGTSPVMHILGKRLGCGPINYQIAYDANGLRFDGAGGCGPSGVCTGIIPPLDTWTHVTGTFDGSTFKFYINGVLVATSGGGGTLGPKLLPTH